MALLFVTLWKYEMASKTRAAQLRALRRTARATTTAARARRQRGPATDAVMPALPLDEAGKYVAAAYLVFLALMLIYVAIMAVRSAASSASWPSSTSSPTARRRRARARSRPPSPGAEAVR